MVASDFGLKSLLETNKTNNFQENPSFLILRLKSTKLNRPLNNQFFFKTVRKGNINGSYLLWLKVFTRDQQN